MFKRVTFVIIVCIISTTLFSQNNVNDYKYVTVPNNFDFLTEADQYRLNTLTKLLFEKYGFTAFMENEPLPDDAISNSCLVLKSNVIKEKGMFNSKLRVHLKNCKGDEIYSSQIGESRDKKYKVAYTLALREAFNSFETLNYSYKENRNILSYGSPMPITNDKEIEKLKEEISLLKEEKEKVKEMAKTPQEIKSEPTASENLLETEENIPVKLIAKGVFNGYDLLDNTSKVVMTIYISGVKDVFIVKGKDAIIYKKGEVWIYSETNDQSLLAKAIDIKF